MADHSGHRQRLRQRALQTRLSGMPPHEILELLLTYTIPLRDVNGLAHELIDRFGSLSGVLRAPGEALSAVPGMGPSAANFLILVGRTLEEYVTPEQTEQAVYTRAVLLTERLRTLPRAPGLHVVCLDARFHLQKTELLSFDVPAPSASEIAGALIRTAIQSRAYNLALVRQGAEAFCAVDLSLFSVFRRMSDGLEMLLMDELLFRADGQVLSLRARERQSPALAAASSVLNSDMTLPDWLEGFPM